MNIYNNIQKYKDIDNKNIIISIYGINYIINYNDLMNNFKNFCNKLNILL